jgi:sucrose-6-phosphate hydrolase SacC (GH32 family)
MAFAAGGWCLMGAESDRPDIVYADFEGETWGDWKVTGAAFGKGPARGTLPGQMHVTGFAGKGLVNSFVGGDGPTGTLTSPEFRIDRKSISLLIGGGGYAGKTCLNLLIDGKTVRTATGPNTQSGGSEELEPAGWDVSEFAGKSAKLEIVDAATGGWGHINVDQIVFTDRPPPAGASTATREITVAAQFLLFPVQAGGKDRKLEVLSGDQIVRSFDIALADQTADWWAPLDVSPWRGKTLTLRVEKLPANSKGLELVEQSDALKGSDNLYHEALRPQIHFSARRGWLNDPNGLVFLNGEYHLFFQHNPYGWNWGNMHWGHAVSRDLVHWEERAEALYPDRFGPMFSGSAVVDWKNTSGLGKPGEPPLVLFYTAAGNPTVQCLASSTDGGRTFEKFDGNPIVKQFTPGNRDPKVLWHEPTKQWVMVLYVEIEKEHTIHFLTSPNLKDWTVTDIVKGLFECPDLFELPVDGDAKNNKWVLTAASSEYIVGTFDGRKFTAESGKLPGHRGRGFYAAQTFSDIPPSDGRRIQIGWLQAPSPGMAFNQAMTVPLQLQLIGTAEGPRLTFSPVRELEALRGKAQRVADVALKAGDPNPLAEAKGELFDIVLACAPAAESELTLKVRGVPIVYNAGAQELIVNGHKAPARLRDGKLELRILADRTAFEVFANDLTYVPMPVIPKAEDRTIEVSVKGGPVKVQSLAAWELKSIWPDR